MSTGPKERALAEAVRDACLEALLQAYEDAGFSGLCAEGRWEIAVQAIRSLNVEEVLHATVDRIDAEDDATQQPSATSG